MVYRIDRTFAVIKERLGAAALPRANSITESHMRASLREKRFFVGHPALYPVVGFVGGSIVSSTVSIAVVQ